MISRTLTILYFVLAASSLARSQDTTIHRQFGDVTLQDFQQPAFNADSSVGAFYLFNIGHVVYVKNNQGYFDIRFTHYARLKLLDKKSFADAAALEIPILVTKDYEEKLADFHARTLNLENGTVTSADYGSKDLMQEKALKIRHGNITVNKFAFPKIKEGSVIEYSYTVQYPGVGNIPAWQFQKTYPCLWNEYETTQPEYYTYLVTKRGSPHFFIDTLRNTIANYGYLEDGAYYNSSDIQKASTQMIDHLWVLKNVPGYVKENFISSSSNYLAAVNFKLYAVQYPNRPTRNTLNNWFVEVRSLVQDEDFALEAKNPGNWINNVVKATTDGVADNIQKAKQIYAYVRDNFTCTGETGIYLSQPLKATLQKKTGSMADLNLLLAAMCNKAGITASPVLLSTRSNGIAPVAYPSVNNYNYVIIMIQIDGQTLLLDASNKFLAFNHLKKECYNGILKVIDNFASQRLLTADSLTETKETSVTIVNGDKGLEGSFTSKLGFIKSYQLRKDLDANPGQHFSNDSAKDYSIPVQITGMTLDSLKNKNERLTLKYHLHFLPVDNDIIYFNPMLAELRKENPFSASTRIYAIDMPYCEDESLSLNLEIPKGYVVDELPKSVQLKLNDKDGLFEYTISNDGNRINLHCFLKTNKANFPREEYQKLRGFYSSVIQKEAEQIVFKKKS